MRAPMTSSGRWIHNTRLPLVLVALVGGASAMGQSARWPQWGGPDRNFVVGSSPLAASWPDAGPKEIWRRALGEGYSSIIVDGPMLYTMYRSGDKEVVVALAADTGKTQWEHAYVAKVHEKMRTDFGSGPNTSPLVHGDRLYTVGISGHTFCLDKRTGKPIWSHDLMKDFDTPYTGFGYSASPVVYKDMLVLLAGGKKGSIMALRLRDGGLVWRNKDYDLSYASPIVINVDGQDQIVVVTDKEVVGLDAATGNAQWTHPHENQFHTNICTPLWHAGNLLFVSSSGESGSRLLKLSRKNGKSTVTELWANKKFGITHSNAIWIGDYIYAQAGYQPTFFAAISAKTGETAFRDRDFNTATCVYSDGKFIILDENGSLMLATATPQGVNVISKADVLENVAWTPPTLVGKRLYLRDKKNIVVLDIG